MREPYKDNRGLKIGEYEKRLDGNTAIYDKKGIRIGEIRPSFKKCVLYDRNNRKLAYWDEAMDVTYDDRGRRISKGDILIGLCFVQHEQEQMEAEKTKTLEKERKRRVDENNRTKGPSKRSKNKSGSAGGGLLLLIIMFFVFRACSNNTDHEDNKVNQSKTIQHEQTDLKQNKSLEISTDSDFIFSDSDERYLTEAEVKALNKDEIRIAINEIYARRGRAFQTPELNEYFSSKSWYIPQYSQAEFSEDVFNEYEKANISLLSKYR